MRAVYQKARHKTFGDIAAILSLTSSSEGALVVSFPRQTAVTLASRILTRGPEELDESIINDCLGEIANVIAGQAKALLASTTHRFTFSTPRVISGTALEDESNSGRNCLVIAFGSDGGDLALQLFPKG